MEQKGHTLISPRLFMLVLSKMEIKTVILLYRYLLDNSLIILFYRVNEVLTEAHPSKYVLFD